MKFTDFLSFLNENWLYIIFAVFILLGIIAKWLDSANGDIVVDKSFECDLCHGKTEMLYEFRDKEICHSCYEKEMIVPRLSIDKQWKK